MKFINLIEIVDEICQQEAHGCRALNLDINSLLQMSEIHNADIWEIPVHENHQVVVLYKLPDDNRYYSLFAGIGLDGNTHLEISIEGTVNGNHINFYDEPIRLKTLL